MWLVSTPCKIFQPTCLHDFYVSSLTGQAKEKQDNRIFPVGDTEDSRHVVVTNGEEITS